MLLSNGRDAWVANTGTSSVIELDEANGAELQNVGGSQYKLDDSDGMLAYGPNLWVSNVSCDCVTELHQGGGALVRVLSGPDYRFQTPAGLVAASGHVFVLDQLGNRLVELDETSGHRIAWLTAAKYHLVHTTAMVVVHGDVWTANGGGDGTLTEIDAATGGVVRIVQADAVDADGPDALAAYGGDLWVLSAHRAHVSIVNASTGRLVRTVTARHAPLAQATSICLSQGRVWVASNGAHPFVDGFLRTNGQRIHDYLHPEFTYPSVFCDAHHVWVVDRLQSRVSELNALSGTIVRVIFD